MKSFKTLYCQVLFFVVIAIFFGCGNKRVSIIPEGEVKRPFIENERLVWKNQKTPDWITIGTKIKGSYLLSVGISGNFSNEYSARESSNSAAFNSLAQYVENRIIYKKNSAAKSVGMSSDIIDYHNVSSIISEQFSRVAVSRFEINNIYVEKWQKSNGQEYYKAFSLGKLPIIEIENSYRKMVNEMQSEYSIMSGNSNDDNKLQQLYSQLNNILNQMKNSSLF